jgi:hypothetical protein
MFNNISWQGYWTTLALISVGYYLVIYLVYYRIDFKLRLHQKPSGETVASLFNFSSPIEKSDERLIDDFMDEVRAFFEQARRKKCVKEELIYSLKIILKKFPSLKDSGFSQSLNHVIATECNHICSIHLSEDELKYVWLDE